MESTSRPQQANGMRETANKPIKLSGHGRLTMVERGATSEEVEDAIRTSTWCPACLGRLECEKVFVFGAEWRGRFYEHKRVRPVFVDLPTEILVVTVYTYYF